MHLNILQATGARNIFCFAIVILESDWLKKYNTVNYSQQNVQSDNKYWKGYLANDKRGFMRVHDNPVIF